MELRDAGDAVAGAAGDRFAGAFAWAAEPARAPAGSGGLVEFVEQGVGFVVEAFGAVQVVVVFGVGQVDVELTESVAVAARAVVSRSGSAPVSGGWPVARVTAGTAVPAWASRVAMSARPFAPSPTSRADPAHVDPILIHELPRASRAPALARISHRLGRRPSHAACVTGARVGRQRLR